MSAHPTTGHPVPTTANPPGRSSSGCAHVTATGRPCTRAGRWRLSTSPFSPEIWCWQHANLEAMRRHVRQLINPDGNATPAVLVPPPPSNRPLRDVEQIRAALRTARDVRDVYRARHAALEQHCAIQLQDEISLALHRVGEGYQQIRNRTMGLAS